MAFIGAEKASRVSKTAQNSTGLTLRLTVDADRREQDTRRKLSHSRAYAVLNEMLQGRAEEVEARCRETKAVWMQGALRWKARLRKDSGATRSHEKPDEIAEINVMRSPQQARPFADSPRPLPDTATLSCMNEFVLLRRIYGRGHLAKVTSALSLTAFLQPVALKMYTQRDVRMSGYSSGRFFFQRSSTHVEPLQHGSFDSHHEFVFQYEEDSELLIHTYVVHALKRGRTAVFGADGLHMTNEYEKVRREIAVQSSLRHPNICPLYGVINDIETGCLHLVLQLLPYPLMEWAEESNAYSARPLHAGHRRGVHPRLTGDSRILVYTEDAGRRILTQILDALDYLHSLNIVHKDIKPQNILSASPPSPADLIVARLPHLRAFSRGPDEEGASFLEGPLTSDSDHQKDMSPSLTSNQHQRESGAPREEEDDREENLLACIMRKRAACPGKSLRSREGAVADLKSGLRLTADQSAEDNQCEGCVSDGSESAEETNFSETDSDEEHGSCDCGPHCACTRVAQVPESAVLRTALAAVDKRLEPYAAYECQVKSAIGRVANTSDGACSDAGADFLPDQRPAADEQRSARPAAVVGAKSREEGNTSQSTPSCNRAQQVVGNVGKPLLTFADAPQRNSEVQELESDTHDEAAQGRLCKPLSATQDNSSEECRPRSSAAVSRRRRSLIESHSTRSCAASRIVGEADGLCGGDEDPLVRVARRIVTRSESEGRLRPLYEVLFEGEANVFPGQAEHDVATDRSGRKDSKELCRLCRTSRFLEDPQLVSNGDGSPVTQKASTSFSVQKSGHHVLQEDAPGTTAAGKDGELNRYMHAHKRSRQRKESPDDSKGIRLPAEGRTSSNLQIAGHEKGSLDSSVSIPQAGVANDAGPRHSPLLTSCNTTAGRAFLSIDERTRWKLADFNCACVTDDATLTIWDSEGTRHFTPPECLGVSSDEGWAGRPRDMWSVGILLYCMFFGTLPFKGNSGLELSVSIMNDNLTFPDHRTLSDPAEDILRQLLSKDPEKRLTSEQVRKHPWLHGEIHQRLT